MPDLLHVLETWDRGLAVQTLRLTTAGPVIEQSAHLLAMELVREYAGVPLPQSETEWLAWGGEAIKRVASWPHVMLEASVVERAKRFVYAVLTSTWDEVLTNAGEDALIVISQAVPTGPTVVGEIDRLAAYLLTEFPNEPGRNGTSESAVDVAIRLLTATKDAASVAEATRKWDEHKKEMPARPHGPAGHLERDADPSSLEQRVDDALARLKEHFDAEVEVLREQVEELAGVPGPRPQPAEAIPVEVRPVPPGPTATVGPGAVPRATAGPLAVTTGTKPAVSTEARRPLEHSLRGDEPRPDAGHVGGLASVEEAE